MEREYVVTLHKFEDLDLFYEDMETPGGNLYIPGRAVELIHRRPTSRNTHYRLTEEEATLVRNDSRVLSVELSLEEQNLKITPGWSQTSSFWNKSNFLNQAHVNWGLLRCVEGTQRSNWGINGTASVSGTAKTTSSGKHVDVVIVDGHINPGHPEFAVNSNGSGGSRIVQFNWFSLKSVVDPSEVRTNYVYTPYVDAGDNFMTSDNDHGAHVAGTVAGNVQGWARDANIYNINPYGTSPSYTQFFLDYVKEWHKQKPINPVTGRKNPTVTNHSYGISASISIADITSVRYRGTIYQGPFTSVQLSSYGINNDGVNAYSLIRNTGIEQDFIDLINQGVIVVGSAGNRSSKISNFSINSADDYNNYFVINFNTIYYYGRGSISAATGVICVGAIGANIDDSKATYSNCGPRVDTYAPGNWIISSVNSTLGVTVGDIRNTTFRLTKYNGTSMSSPQVTGLLACLAEQQPRLSQTRALDYIKTNFKLNQITSTSGGPADLTDLQGSTNRYAYYVKERSEEGQTTPTMKQGLRPINGMVYPRPKIYRYGS